MNLYFQRSSGERVFIKHCNTKQDVSECINEFLCDHAYKSYYTRVWRENDEVWFDVGSWTEFFILDDPKNKYKIGEDGNGD